MSISLIPESAPFSEEQRAWLNGFLAGWVGLLDEPASTAFASPVLAAVVPSESPAKKVAEEEVFPWHDPSLEIEQRLELAEGKPLERQLMAAMAQLDCGACGYVCKTYSEAIADGQEKNLTLCSPGGKATAKMLKQLVKAAKPAGTENGVLRNGNASNGAVANGAAANGTVIHGTLTNGAAANACGNTYSRANPYVATVKSTVNLNGAGSAKVTTHVVIDVGEDGLQYKVGDSLGVFPTNCPDLVEEILAVLDLRSDESLRQNLRNEFCLRTVTEELLENLADCCTSLDESMRLRSLIDSDELDTLDVLDVLRMATGRIDAPTLCGCLMKLAPRLYSIASSPAAHPGEVHLTVGRASYRNGNREYKGVASTMFSDRMGPGSKLKVFVHDSHGFTVPQDPAAPMIMVGPGTGIAPFRAFLEERCAGNAPGKNWLFFGEQHAATDFLYESELKEMFSRGKLTRLSVAFSRDQEEKIYVQDRMREEGAELFQWLEQGAYFYVCGDARRMATDVERALHTVVARHGGMSEHEARQYVDRLKAAGRYLRDVY